MSLACIQGSCSIPVSRLARLPTCHAPKPQHFCSSFMHHRLLTAPAALLLPSLPLHHTCLCRRFCSLHRCLLLQLLLLPACKNAASCKTAVSAPAPCSVEKQWLCETVASAGGAGTAAHGGSCSTGLVRSYRWVAGAQCLHRAVIHSLDCWQQQPRSPLTSESAHTLVGTSIAGILSKLRTPGLQRIGSAPALSE